MGEKTLRELAEAAHNAQAIYDGTCEASEAEVALERALAVRWSDTIGTPILAALDAEAAQADAAGYERGRREALEEVRAWLFERVALAVLAVLDDEAATEENEDMCMAALDEIQHAREDFIRRFQARGPRP